MTRFFSRILIILSVVAMLLVGMTGVTLAAPRIPTTLALPVDATLPDGQVKLTWAANSNPTGTQYEVWRKALRPDGTVESDEPIYSGTDRTLTTSDQSPGQLYTYRARSYDGSEYSSFTDEISFWSPPALTVQESDGNYLLSWDSVQDDYMIDPGNIWALTVNPKQTTSKHAYIPGNLYASKAQVTWSGFDGGVDYYIRYWDGTEECDIDGCWNNYYNVPSTYTLLPGAEGSIWVTLPRTARDIRLYVRDKGSTSAGQINITGLEIVSPVRYQIQRSTNGTTWTNLSSNYSGTSITIPAASLSPASRYQFALYPSSLPNGGTLFRSINTTWYSPLYPAVAAVAVANETPTGGRIYWSRGSITSSTPITVYRDGVQVYRGAPSYSSTTIGGVSGSWGYFADTGLVTGQTYSYSICAENALGNCSPVTLTYMPTAAVPTTLAISTTAPANNQITLTWNANGNPSGTQYEVWRKTLRSDGTVETDELIHSGTALSASTTDQQPGRYYRYRALALDSVTTSPPSTEIDYWTPPIPTVTQVGTNLLVSWDAVQTGSATRYNVSYSLNGTTWSTAQNGVTGTELSIAYPGSITPLNKYRIALQQYTLPNGGPSFRAFDEAWYSPLWPAPLKMGTDGISANGATIWWARGRSTSGIAATAAVRVYRDSTLIWEGVPGYAYSSKFGTSEDWASFTDSGALQPDTTYQYTVCALNALSECGPALAFSVQTLPSVSGGMTFQQGSFGWSRTATGGAWAEIIWEPVPSATSYKVYVNGVGTNVGNVTSHRLTLDSGTAYTIKVAAVNASGEGGAQEVAFITPARMDATAPTNGQLVLNEGAAITSGGRVRARVSASDALSGVIGVQLSNDGKTWSPVSVMRDWSYDNLINAGGGNAYFTDLGGWESGPGVWSTIKADSAARGGSYVNIQRDRADGRWTGLRLADLMPVTPGETYAIRVRYRVNGLTTGSVGIWSHFVSGSGGSAAAADHLLENTSAWKESTFVVTAPSGAVGRSLVLGFDQANPGASLDIDYIHVAQGRQVFEIRNQLSSTPVFILDWEIPTNDFTPKTVGARFVDLAGNVSATVNATIQFMVTDTKSPSVTVKINGGTALVTSQRTVTLQISAVDDQTPQGSLRMRIANGSGAFRDWERFSPTTTWTLCDSADEYCEGERTVWVEVQDAAGNIGSGFAKVFFRLDSTPISGGAFTVVEGSSGRFRVGTTSVEVTFTRVSEVTLKWNVGATSLVRYGVDPAVFGPWETYSQDRAFTLPGRQGIQTVYAQLEDGRIFVQRFLLDSSAPTFTASWAGGATITQPGGKATLVLAAQDNLATPEDLKVSVNGGPWIDFKSEIPITLTGTGLKSVSIRIMDPAGNESSQTLSIFIN